MTMNEQPATESAFATEENTNGQTVEQDSAPAVLATAENTDGQTEQELAPARKLTKEEKRARLREIYTQDLNNLLEANTPTFQQVQAIAESLEEINVVALYRMSELFGLEVMQQKAEEALSLFYKTRAKGPKAYQPSEKGTSTATQEGKPRSPGGIFFYLMIEYGRTQGYSRTKLNLPWYPFDLPEFVMTFEPRKPKAEKAPLARSDKKKRK